MNKIEHILKAIGIGPLDRHDLEITELIELNIAISIDNHLKIKQVIMNLDDLKTKVDTLQGQVKTNNDLLARMNADLTRLSADLKTAIASGDQAKLQAIADELDLVTESLANADTVNNPDAQTIVTEPGATAPDAAPVSDPVVNP